MSECGAKSQQGGRLIGNFWYGSTEASPNISDSYRLESFFDRHVNSKPPESIFDSDHFVTVATKSDRWKHN